eukprot:10363610-Lingulodinium_polyedra.AAC.1
MDAYEDSREIEPEFCAKTEAKCLAAALSVDSSTSGLRHWQARQPEAEELEARAALRGASSAAELKAARCQCN